MKCRTLDSLGRQVVACRLCPRLVEHREEVARVKRRAYRDWTYWGKPVPGFGDPRARLLILGLAPGAHGANRTGRVFTGDRSGLWLYRALHRAGLASQAESRERRDDLRLVDCYIGLVVRCVPPGNLPARAEIESCLPYLHEEVRLLERLEVVLALGRLAFDAALRLVEERRGARLRPRPRFAHGAVYEPGEGLPRLVASYHPSQQNTSTGRLTEEMLDQAISRAR